MDFKHLRGADSCVIFGWIDGLFFFSRRIFLFIFYTFVCLTLSLYALNALDFLIVMAISGRKYYIYTVYTMSSIYKYAMQYSPFLSCQQCELQWISSSSRNSVCYCVYTWPSAGIFFIFFFIIALPVETLRVALDLVDLQVVPENTWLPNRLTNLTMILSLSLSHTDCMHCLFGVIAAASFSYSCSLTALATRAINHKDLLHAKQCTMLSLGQLRLRSLSLSLTHSLLKCLMEFVIKQTTREQ